MTNDEYTTITIEKDNDAETNKKVKSMGSESGDNSDVEVVTIEGEKSMESETFLLSFVIATSTSPDQLSDNNRSSLLMTAVTLGAIHLTIEVRQFIWKPLKYIKDFWNYFAIVTSILWLHYNDPPPVQLISGSNLLLDLRLMLFLRVFSHTGAYFTIIIGVAKKVFWFLIIIMIIILSFSHAFFLLLKPSQNFTIDQPTINNDSNNPWNLVNKYYTYFANNNSYSQDSYFIQQPDGNTNMFTLFPSSILAMYNFLAGDNEAFKNRVLQDDAYLILLMVAFSFIVVVYLMNLFIGLLGNEIEHYDTKEAFWFQKAKVITEIELFYLLPNQRRWRTWFPDILSYNVPIDDIRKEIKKADDSNNGEENPPYIPDRLRELAPMITHLELENLSSISIYFVLSGLEMINVNNQNDGLDILTQIPLEKII
ncbi:2849_t:CDS:2 [Entrophospora sp. SA101]|nr:2849_t:CDS:2 [Entrophospora sp. SA101]